jgi:enoyl-CoA hydratase/carnithine racemase
VQTNQVRVEKSHDDLVATVVIDNSVRLNSMNTDLMDQFVSAVASLAEDLTLRAVIVTGAGQKAFVGGADIKEMAKLEGPDQAREFITSVHECCAALRSVPVPTIARINGHTFGAGLELAASCDLRIASRSAQFGMPEVRLGIPSVVEAALLPSLVGWGRTRQMLLLGETFSAEQAEAWGFLDRVLPADELNAAVAEWIAQILACAPRAVRLQKELIRSWEDLPLGAAIQAGIASFASAFETDEPAVRMREFFEEQARRKRSVASDATDR